jgi:hypothetical protein
MLRTPAGFPWSGPPSIFSPPLQLHHPAMSSTIESSNYPMDGTGKLVMSLTFRGFYFNAFQVLSSWILGWNLIAMSWSTDSRWSRHGPKLSMRLRVDWTSSARWIDPRLLLFSILIHTRATKPSVCMRNLMERSHTRNGHPMPRRPLWSEISVRLEMKLSEVLD